MPDIVNVIIWVFAGFAGGMAAGDLLKGDDDLGPAVNMLTGVSGGVVGAFILHSLIPTSSTGAYMGLIIGQLIVAAASGAIVTAIVRAVRRRRL